MADQERTDGPEDRSADTASFKRFVDDVDPGPSSAGNGFRLITLLIGVVVLVAIVALLLI